MTMYMYIIQIFCIVCFLHEVIFVCECVYPCFLREGRIKNDSEINQAFFLYVCMLCACLLPQGLQVKPVSAAFSIRQSGAQMSCISQDKGLNFSLPLYLSHQAFSFFHSLYNSNSSLHSTLRAEIKHTQCRCPCLQRTYS